MCNVQSCSSRNPQPSQSLECWTLSCFVHTRSQDGQSPSCKWEWGWCQPQASGAWWTDDWRCSCWCTGRRVEVKGHNLEGNRCWWSESQRHVSPARCVQSDRKSVIHLQVESGMFSWESLSFSTARMIVLKAKLKSTDRILEPGCWKMKWRALLTASSTDLLR